MNWFCKNFKQKNVLLNTEGYVICMKVKDKTLFNIMLLYTSCYPMINNNLYLFLVLSLVFSLFVKY